MIPFSLRLIYHFPNPSSYGQHIMVEKLIFSYEDIRQHIGGTFRDFDFTLKQNFNELPLVEFWCSLLQEYSEVSE
jgi:hypothetical protein